MMPIPNGMDHMQKKVFVLSTVCFDPAGNYLWLEQASPDEGH